jgi:lipopolysaccharide export system permease protein
MWFGKIERYLAQSVVWPVLAAMLLLTALLGFSELLSQLGRLSENYPLTKALLFALLKMPAYAYEVFPMALLIGVLAGMGQLAAQSELTIIRASGWSPSRILLALAKGLLLIWLMMLLVGESLAPWAEKTALQLRLVNGAQHLSLAGETGFWTKDQRRYITAQTVVKQDQLAGVIIYELDIAKDRYHVIQAQQADFDAISRQWILREVREQQVATEAIGGDFPFTGLTWQQTQQASLPVTLPFEPMALSLMAQDKKNWSWIELRSQIDSMKASGLQTQTLELALWRKLAHPISLLAMLALALTLLLSAGRSASMGGRVLLGIVIGLVFFLLNRVVGDMVALANLPAVISAFLLPTMILLVSLMLLARMR